MKHVEKTTTSPSMAVTTEQELPDALRASWLKAVSAMQLRNYKYVLQLVPPILKVAPNFLPARQLARKAAAALQSGKKTLFGMSGGSLAALKLAPQVKKDPAAALVAIEEELADDPHSPQLNGLLKEAALALNMPETAAFALETILEGNPKDTKTLHELAQLHMQYDQPEKAAEVFNKILEINPSDLIAAKGAKDAAARITIQKGGWDSEQTTYRELIRDKEQAVSLEQQARVVRSEEMIDRQLAELHQQVEAQPQSIELSRRIAELYEQKGDLGSAIQWFDYAYQLGGGADLALARKSSELKLKQFSEAIEQWQAYLDSHPGEEEAANARAQLEELKRQRDEFRLQDAQQRVEKYPTDLQFRYELGEIYFQVGRPQDAIPELQRARQNPNVRLRASFMLGRCYEAKGLLDLAAKTLSEAASEIPTMDSLKKDILYTLGLIYEKSGQRENYLDCMKKIYEVDYGYRDVAPRVEGAAG